MGNEKALRPLKVVARGIKDNRKYWVDVNGELTEFSGNGELLTAMVDPDQDVITVGFPLQDPGSFDRFEFSSNLQGYNQSHGLTMVRFTDQGTGEGVVTGIFNY